MKKKKRENLKGSMNPSEEESDTKEEDQVVLTSLDWIKAFAFALVLALLINNFVFEPTKVAGSSMEETLHDKDRLIIGKLNLKFRDLDRRDIIVMKYNSKDDYIKRIVGLPGEYIQIIDGRVFINGQEYEEDYINTNYTEIINGFEWKLREDEYFVMGDNRIKGKSKDSRDFGPIKREQIKGRAVFRFYPFNESFGKIYN